MTIQRSTLRLVTAGFVLMITAAAAHAFSDEAVSDAQKLLETVNQRFQAGEVWQSDVALARYNLLEMRLNAGQISLDAFCRAAVLELKAVAKDLDDEQAGQKTKLLNAAAGMAESESKCREAMAATASLLFGDTNHPASEATVRQAEAAFAEMLDRHAFGSATTLDVARAQFAVLETKYHAGQISRAAFCRGAISQAPNAISQAQRLVKAVIDLQAIGQASLGDEIAARRKLYEIKALCTG